MNEEERRRKEGVVSLGDCSGLVVRFLEQHEREVGSTLADLNQMMLDEHARELRDCRKRSQGEMPKLGLYEKVYHRGREMRTYAEPLWFVSSDAEDSFDRTYVYYTRQITRRLACGDYCRSDFEKALPKLARWEVQLVWEYERRAQVLREYMRQIEKVACDLLDLPDMPSIYALEEVGDMGLPPSELDW